jgi:NitT/TauT family transport system ATP-binding protein
MEAVQLSSRIVIVAYGGRKFADLTIDLPYPRLQTDPEVATTQAHILEIFEDMERKRLESDPRIAELAEARQRAAETG